MDRPRFQKTEAIVLKHVNIGEADRIVTLYTPHSGKVRAVARGVRRAKSRLAGHLELLTTTQVLIHRGKALDVISQSETIASNLDLRVDLWRMTCGLYMAELVERFSQEQQENINLYRHLKDSLATLGTTANVNMLLRHFEMRLLDLTGYHPELGRCVECEAPLAPVTNYFSPSAGGVLCPDCRLAGLGGVGESDRDVLCRADACVCEGCLSRKPADLRVSYGGVRIGRLGRGWLPCFSAQHPWVWPADCCLGRAGGDQLDPVRRIPDALVVRLSLGKRRVLVHGAYRCHEYHPADDRG